LSVQAAEVTATALSRLGCRPPEPAMLRRADGSRIPLNLAERPPIAETGDTR
jgi:hypothetical protein